MPVTSSMRSDMLPEYPIILGLRIGNYAFLLHCFVYIVAHRVLAQRRFCGVQVPNKITLNMRLFLHYTCILYKTQNVCCFIAALWVFLSPHHFRFVCCLTFVPVHFHGSSDMEIKAKRSPNMRRNTIKTRITINPNRVVTSGLALFHLFGGFFGIVFFTL